jgi:hypothetical protein
VLRVLKINIPDETQYPLQGRSTFGKDDPGLNEALGNQEPALEDQDAKMFEDDDQEGSQREDFQLSMVSLRETYKGPRRVVRICAGCHVDVKRDSESCVSPIGKFSAEDFPNRTTCHRKDDAWFIIDQNFILWPKYEDLNEAVAACEVMFTIFSKDIIDLCKRVEEEIKLDEVIPGDDPSDKDMIEVINPSTGIMEKIRRDDPQYYSADGFKTRRHKGSRKPMDIPSFVWQSMSVKARREAIGEEQMKLARSGT